jgi:hypothetical protein
MKTRLTALILMAATFAGLATVQGVNAQYPPVVGSSTCTSTDSSPAADSTVVLGCTVRDAAGNPAAGVPATIAITSEPGTDAAVGSKVVTKVTDANGRVAGNVYVGTTPGTLVIDVTVGNIGSRVLINVLPTVAFAPTSAAPVVGAIQPPRTGDAGLADSDGNCGLLALSLLVLIAATARRRTRSI